MTCLTENGGCTDFQRYRATDMPGSIKRKKPKYCTKCKQIWLLNGHRGPYVAAGIYLRQVGEMLDGEVSESIAPSLQEPM
jgi:hypothetical protein